MPSLLGNLFKSRACTASHKSNNEKSPNKVASLDKVVNNFIVDLNQRRETVAHIDCALETVCKAVSTLGGAAFVVGWLQWILLLWIMRRRFVTDFVTCQVILHDLSMITRVKRWFKNSFNSRRFSCPFFASVSTYISLGDLIILSHLAWTDDRVTLVGNCARKTIREARYSRKNLPTPASMHRQSRWAKSDTALVLWWLISDIVSSFFTSSYRRAGPSSRGRIFPSHQFWLPSCNDQGSNKWSFIV